MHCTHGQLEYLHCIYAVQNLPVGASDAREKMPRGMRNKDLLKAMICMRIIGVVNQADPQPNAGNSPAGKSGMQFREKKCSSGWSRSQLLTVWYCVFLVTQAATTGPLSRRSSRSQVLP